jgi:ASC-1-like (ASCH) protein
LRTVGLPLFIVKKEVFEWIRTGQKTIELRKGRAREDDRAVLQSGRNIIKRLIQVKRGITANLSLAINLSIFISLSS